MIGFLGRENRAWFSYPEIILQAASILSIYLQAQSPCTLTFLCSRYYSSHKRLRLRSYQQATCILPKVAEFAIFLIVYFLRYTNPAVLKCNIKSHIRQLLIQQHHQLVLSLWANNGCKYKWCSESSGDWKAAKKNRLYLPQYCAKDNYKFRY